MERIFIFIAFLHNLLIAPICLAGEAFPATHRFLSLVSAHSGDFEISKIEELNLSVSAETLLANYDLRSVLAISKTESDDPLTSPFATSSTSRTLYSAGFSKKWLMGFETKLDYSVSDTSLTFPGRPDIAFLSPDLSVALSTSVFKDLLGGRSRNTQQEIKTSQKIISLDARIKRKTILVQSLLHLSEILELKKSIQLEKKLCQQIEKQSQKLNAKYKKRSISKKDYLLSQQEANTCRSNIHTLESARIEKIANIQSLYGLPITALNDMTNALFFDEVREAFKVYRHMAPPEDLSNRDDIIAIKENLRLTHLQEARLSAEARTEMTLELTAGYRGLGDRFSLAQENIYDTEYPYLMGSLTIEFPFSNREAKTNLIKNQYQARILKKRLEMKSQEVRRRFLTLKESIMRNLSNYEELVKNGDLARQILKEAQKDFSNGRIDFVELFEHRKSLILSQKKILAAQSLIVSQTIEVADYFRFFDRYF